VIFCVFVAAVFQTFRLFASQLTHWGGAMPSADASLRTRLRRQLLSGQTERGHTLGEDRKKEMWAQMLDLHVALPIPGRALALLDVRHMLDTFRVRLSDQYGGESSEPRALSEDERRAISEWLRGYNSALPAEGEQLRGVEESLAAQAEVNVERVIAGQEKILAEVAALRKQTEGCAIIGDALNGKVPERAEGQSAGSRTRQLQNVKSLVDIELRPIRAAWEDEKIDGKKKQYKIAEDLSKIDLTLVPVAEGIDAVMKMHTVNVQLYRDSMAMLKKRKAEEVAWARKRRKTGPASGAGGGLGGFSNRQCALPRTSCEARGPGLGGVGMAQRSGA
jgi:hypothetical protein